MIFNFPAQNVSLGLILYVSPVVRERERAHVGYLQRVSGVITEDLQGNIKSRTCSLLLYNNNYYFLNIHINLAYLRLFIVTRTTAS